MRTAVVLRLGVLRQLFSAAVYTMWFPCLDQGESKNENCEGMDMDVKYVVWRSVSQVREVPGYLMRGGSLLCLSGGAASHPETGFWEGDAGGGWGAPLSVCISFSSFSGEL